MKRTLLLACACVAISSSAALAQTVQKEGPYVSFSAGYLQAMDEEGEVNGVEVEGEFEGGYSLNGAFGYKFGAFRTEIELGFGQTGFEKLSAAGLDFDVDGDIDLFTGTVNGFFDLNTGTSFTPYIGAGIGVAHTSIDDITVSFGGVSETVEGDSSTDLMALGEVGISYAVNQNLSVAPSYRFVWINNGSDELDDTTAHLFRVALRYSF